MVGNRNTERIYLIDKLYIAKTFVSVAFVWACHATHSLVRGGGNGRARTC